MGTLVDVSDSGWAAVPRAVLEREAALLGETLGACLAVLDTHCRIHWAANGPAALMGMIREHVGQGLGSLLPGGLLDMWLDWLVEAAAVS